MTWHNPYPPNQPPQFIYPQQQPATFVVDREVKVVYTDATPDTVWGPFTQPAAEQVAAEFAKSPQVIHTVTIQAAGTGA